MSSKTQIKTLIADLLKRLDECSPEQLAEIEIAISRHQHQHP